MHVRSMKEPYQLTPWPDGALPGQMPNIRKDHGNHEAIFRLWILYRHEP